MANTVRIKRRASGASGAPTSLANAELAFNEVDDVLYYGKGSGGAGGSASTVEAIGGKGAFVGLTGDQTIGGNKTFSNVITGAITGNAGSATQLANGRTIAMTGDVSWTSASFNGTANVTGTATLANSGVTAGTYKSVTVDAKGRVTGGTNPTTLSGYGITDAQALDADLTAIAGLSGTSGFLKKTAANTWSLDTNTYITGINSGNVTTALGYTPENSANKGQANGYASLGSDGKVPSNQLPSYVDDVLEYANIASFPATGESGVIYVAIDTNKVYRWSGSTYVEISASPGTTDSVTEGSTNLYFTQARARQSISASGSISYNNSTGVISFTDAVTSVAGKTGAVTLAKGDVGLGNVENTALSTWTGSTAITTLGTIATGVWSGTTIAVNKGGTGATTLTGLVKGNGTSAFTAAVAGTDYISPDSTIDGGTF
jgi:phage-related tail fiber protein